jgi:hypothetical protein
MKIGIANAIEEATNHFDELKISEDETVIIQKLFEFAYEYRNVEFMSIGTRERNIVETNACLSNIILKHFPFPLRVICSIFKKHHSSVIHYRKLHDNCLIHDKQYLKLFKALNEMVRDLLLDAKSHDEVLLKIGSSKSFKDDLISELKFTITSLKVMNSKLKEELYIIKEKKMYEKRNTPCDSIL